MREVHQSAMRQGRWAEAEAGEVKSLKILSKAWRVVPLRHQKSDKTIYYGKTDHLAGTIAVNKRVTRQQRLDTMLHETIHVIDGELKIGLTERDVCCLATALAGFVIDNPTVFKRGHKEKS